MKRMNPLPCLIAAAIVSGCGGGGGGSDTVATVGPLAPVTDFGRAATPTPAGDAASAPGPSASSPITVSAVTAPSVTTADCARLASEADSIAALDLANADIRAVNDFVLAVDPEHAYKVFVRRPHDFVTWIAGGGGVLNLLTLGVATHETLHMTDAVLRGCAPSGYKALFFGKILDTGLQVKDTTSIRIVDAEIDPALKSEPRFTTYITNAAAGNDFTVLLDEFAAYAGAAHTTFRAQALGRSGAATGALDSDLGGSVVFMVFLETYLRATRLHAPVSYERIRSSAATRLALQTLWDAAEQVLRDSYPFVTSGSPRLRVNSAYFAAAYSARLLQELDAIGIAHASAASWSGTYLP